MIDALTPTTSKVAVRLARAKPADVIRFAVTDRASWLELRRRDVTASVIAALLGEHPYTTPFGLYAAKTGQIEDAEVEPVLTATSISLPPMLRGTVLEPLAPKLILMLRPSWSIEPCGWYYREPSSRIGATPDFIAINPDRKGAGIVQVKTTDQQSFRRDWCDEAGEVVPPMFVVVQAIVEAVLTGLAWANVAVMVSGPTLDLHLIPIPLHLGVMARLRNEVAAFWQRVDAGDPPPVDYARDGDVVAAMYREDNGREIDLTGVNHLPELLERRDQLKAEIKTAAGEVGRIDTELKSRLGSNEAAIVGDRRITWRTETRRLRFVPQSESRVLRVSHAR